ncbi:LysR substrate-binding domain-containing protein [Pseudochelatococcus sp. B33]
MRKLPPLNSIRAFEAAARNRSFTAAATELCVTMTAVSHQIRHLEEQLGQKLFERTPREVRLTALGEKLYPALRDGFDRFAEAFEQIHDRNGRESLTVTTTRAFAERWLMPRLPGFTGAAPGVDVHVEATEELVDLRRSDVDVAIRYGHQPKDDLSSTLLLQDMYGPVASADCPGIASRQIEDYRSMPLLAYKWVNRALDAPDWARWLEAAGKPPVDTFRVSWFNDESLAMHAMERGMGPLLCSDIMTEDAVRERRAVRLDGPLLPGFGYHLAYLPGRHRRRPVARFCEWLRAEAADFIERPRRLAVVP